MSAYHEVEIKICSANDLKNVNWRHGDIKPYAVVWVDPKSKFSTKVDDNGDICPIWDETLVLPLTYPIQDSTLSIDIVHAYAAKDTKPLIGSVQIPIQEIVDDVGIGNWAHRTLKLKRPSGRPHGRLEVKILVREPRYRGPDPYYAPPPSYGVPPPTSRNYQEDYRYPNQNPYPYASAPPSGYPYNPPGYPQQQTYGAPGYPQQQTYGAPGYSGDVVQQKKGSKFGVGTGLAVGAVAGVLGGLALAEGIDYVEDKIADDVEKKIADDLVYDDDDGYGEDF
ncbi:Calcium-dependent lipid-binding (CaLB domain) family protein [Thalictrum thalictroides]|uniref:Calcium-dependent lipid-binding (CaLB domain) family protein n=1 Tax=Thalictrum thalictroides TaxID=46969 RepID=A0A7J6WYM9_THATH|nr:Calcium-dependent lipid-binding (CaLB domain) family protein [Thalictrum thalictroides]